MEESRTRWQPWLETFPQGHTEWLEDFCHVTQVCERRQQIHVSFYHLSRNLALVIWPSNMIWSDYAPSHCSCCLEDSQYLIIWNNMLVFLQAYVTDPHAHPYYQPIIKLSLVLWDPFRLALHILNNDALQQCKPSFLSIRIYFSLNSMLAQPPYEENIKPHQIFRWNWHFHWQISGWHNTL